MSEPRIIVPPDLEPLTLEEGKQRAGLDWTPGDPRDALMLGFIRAARADVERRTGLALLTQTRDVTIDPPYGAAFSLERAASPLQAVLSVTTRDLGGVESVLDPGAYVATGGWVWLASGNTWPGPTVSSGWVVRVVVGWPSVEALTLEAPLLVHAVGLLTAHYATLGRDLASVDAATPVPFGYEDALSSYLPVVVA